MNGASRAALEAAGDRLEALVADAGTDLVALAGELAEVCALLDREVSLRRVLTDPARPAEQKAELLGSLLTSQLSSDGLDLATGMVRARWSAPRDLVDSLEELAADADLAAAERAGELDDVEDELFRFARILDSTPELHRALTDQAVPASARGDLVGSLLDGRAHAVTIRLVRRLVTAPRGRRLEQGLERTSRQAAERRQRLVATVRAAVPLDERQKQRLGAALAKLYGRPVHLNIDIDPEVLGGVSVRIGDDVIDGTITSRLDAARRGLAG